MLAGSSALAWPSLKGYITPPAVTSAMPELFVPASAAASGLRGMIVPDAAAPPARAFVAETLVQISDSSPTQPTDAFAPPQRNFASQGNDSSSYFLGTDVETSRDTSNPDGQTSPEDSAASFPNDGSDSEAGPPPLPLLVAPRQPFVRTPVLRSASDLDRPRGRLEGHWAVGKFR